MIKFSIIIPTFNRARYLTQAIESVFAQRYTHWEMIVIDDGSTDNTSQVLEQYGHRLRVIRQQNQGQAAARNAGIAAATGDYVAFLDDDDLWFPWTLATYAKAAEGNDQPSLIVGQPVPFVKESELKDVAQGPQRMGKKKTFFSAPQDGGFVGAPTTVVRAASVKRIGGFADVRVNGEDLDLLLRLGYEPGFVRISSPSLVGYRQHRDSDVQNQQKNYQGMLFLMQREKSGAYASGASAARPEAEVVGRIIRNWSFRFLETGHHSLAWRLYLRGMPLQLRLGRVRYLGAFPILAAHAVLTGTKHHKNESGDRRA